MPEVFTIQGFASKGSKPNPHGGVLHKWEVSLDDEQGQTHHGVYWQSKSDELHIGQEVYGEISDGEYGPRFRTAQREDGAPRPSQSGSGGRRDDPERSRRIERQHSQEMALRFAAIVDPPDCNLTTIKDFTDWFQQDLDADVGGGAGHSTGDAAARVESVTADVSAEMASPQLKGKATQLLNKAGLAPEARKAIILFRCGTLSSPPREAVQRLVNDLEQGATADALLAEVVDAHRSGKNPTASEAVKLIPTDVPNAEPPEEPVPANGDEIPF